MGGGEGISTKHNKEANNFAREQDTKSEIPRIE